jgi:hypothetical protein
MNLKCLTTFSVYSLFEDTMVYILWSIQFHLVYIWNLLTGASDKVMHFFASSYKRQLIFAVSLTMSKCRINHFLTFDLS